MHTGRSIFSQLLDFLPKHTFDRCVARYKGNHRVRHFSCFNQYLCMAFAQLTYRDGLRDIEICLRAMRGKLYHAGFRGSIARSTLADANEARDWRIYADFAHALIKRARKLYADDSFGVELKQAVYAFDSTTIDLCLSLFPWARFRRRKGAIKLHTQIDLRGTIPCFIRISDGKLHDVNLLDEIPIEAGAFYLFDRGYTDFERLYVFTVNMAFFVIPAKSNLDYRLCAYRHVDRKSGLRSDHTIKLNGPATQKLYPDPLRRVVFYDKVLRHRIVLLTNNFVLPALTIADLYRCRWRVEIFFKWIKQHLRIKSFFGTSFNAVRTQVWIAISVYVLVAIAKKKLGIDRNLSEILQILSISLFEKMPIQQALAGDPEIFPNNELCNQLILFTS
jgi:IS4 transposase